MHEKGIDKLTNKQISKTNKNTVVEKQFCFFLLYHVQLVI